MNLELKNKWCAALRGGEFKQGKGALVYIDEEGLKYCCLGVLGAISGGHINYDLHGATAIIWNGEKYFTHLNFDQGGLGINTQITLMKLNDDEKRTFSEIADWIEENVMVVGEKSGTS